VDWSEATQFSLTALVVASAYYFKENKLLMHYYTTNQCEKAKVRCIANFNSDTLSITFLNESIKKNKAYFIKYDVLNEFLDGWKPDW
jgi:uncharacterized protein YtpQ (UPF0354 family)